MKGSLKFLEGNRLFPQGEAFIYVEGEIDEGSPVFLVQQLARIEPFFKGGEPSKISLAGPVFDVPRTTRIPQQRESFYARTFFSFNLGELQVYSRERSIDLAVFRKIRSYITHRIQG